MRRFSLCLFLLFANFSVVDAFSDTAFPVFDANQALKISQSAVGRSLDAYTLFDQDRHQISLDAFRGKPLLISLVYTSCFHTCSVVTRALDMAVKKARDALGMDRFNVVTIGFDTPVDTPEAMGRFARQHGISGAYWHFLSGDAATLERLMANLGFGYVRSLKGFDHLVQATLVEAGGRITQQIYGEVIQTPQLVEPLKALILGLPAPAESSLEHLARRVRLFCTTYDPSTDAYRFDYSLFVGLFAGMSIFISAGIFLFREARRAKKLRDL